ncbi:MAG: flagellar basal body rod protein FlgB [Bacillota bacterium]
MSNFLNNSSISVLAKSLDGLQQRQQAISDNIANVDTPNYKRKRVDFKSQLKSQLNNDNLNLNATDGKHYSSATNLDEMEFQTKVERNSKLRFDRNNVNIDQEMSKLAKNGLEYQAVSQLLSKQFRKLSNTVSKLK